MMQLAAASILLVDDDADTRDSMFVDEVVGGTSDVLI